MRLKKRPIFALFLSAIFPGLGQLYNGDIWKGMVLLAIGLVLGWMSTQAISLDALQAGKIPSGLGRFVILSILLLGAFALSMVDAYRSAKRHG